MSTASLASTGKRTSPASSSASPSATRTAASASCGRARGQRDLITVVGHAAPIGAGEFMRASTHGVQFPPISSAWHQPLHGSAQAAPPHRAGKPIDKCAIYKILNNRVHLGEAIHKGKSYPGEHEAIIDRATWDNVHTILAANTVARANATRAQMPALLRGLIFAPGGHAMTPTHTRKDGKLYRYYVATDAIRQGYSECHVRSVPAAEVEEAVVAQVRHLLRTPEIMARTWAAAKHEAALPEREVVQTVTDFAPFWDELFPAEQARIVRLLVERVELTPDGITVRLRADGLQTLVEELQSREAEAA